MNQVFIAHCKVYGLSAVSCAKMAELIKMQCGMLSRVDPGNVCYMGYRRRHWKGHF